MRADEADARDAGGQRIVESRAGSGKSRKRGARRLPGARAASCAADGRGAAMVAAVGVEGGVRPIEHRLAEAMRLPPLVVWIAVTSLFLALCGAWRNARGAWRGLTVDGEPFWRTPWQLEIVFAVILGYLVACGGWIVRSVRRGLDALAPALAIE